jgi:dienelactone hydrolase
MKYLLISIIFLFAGYAVAHAELRTESVEYKDGDILLKGYLAYDDAIKEKRPAVIVVHEWWGLNRYIENRTVELAKLGYIAFAIDMYGKGENTNDPKKAGQLSGTFTKNREKMRERANAGLETFRKNNLVDPERIAAIGYCFGGTTVLELARSGAGLKGVVSFHGELDTPSPGDAKNIKGSVLVLQGADDPFSSREKVEAFQDEMERAGVDWQMNIYGGAEHGFTNPEADSYGIKGVAYDKKTDKRSWEAMKNFFREIFK